MTSRRGKKSQKRDNEEEEEDDDRVLFYIPSEDIDIEVLVYYLKLFLGHESDAEPGTHPRNRDEDGYFVRSRLGLSAAMVGDLKRDSAAWKKEKRAKRSRLSYHESETAEKRQDLGASGEPTIPKKTQEKLDAARRAASQPIPSQSSMGAQRPVDRHQVPQDVAMQTGSYSSAPWQQQDQTQRPQGTYSGQNTSFAYSNPTNPQNRPSPAINLNVNMNTAAYTQNPPPRHMSPQQSNLMPSIEGRYQTPAPPYEGEDSKPNQPSTTGSHGFNPSFPTAGSRHDRR